MTETVTTYDPMTSITYRHPGAETVHRITELPPVPPVSAHRIPLRRTY